MKASSKKILRFVLILCALFLVLTLAALFFFTLRKGTSTSGEEPGKTPASPGQADTSPSPAETVGQDGTTPEASAGHNLASQDDNIGSGKKQIGSQNISKSQSTTKNQNTSQSQGVSKSQSTSQQDGSTKKEAGSAASNQSTSSGQSTASGKTEEKADASNQAEEQVADWLAAMSLEEKVAQLFFITPEALTGFQTVTATGKTTKEALDRYPVGGLIYFAQNLTSPEQTKKMLSTTQDYMTGKQGFPIFLGVDEEGGRVRRIGSKKAFQVKRIDAMGKLAKKKDRNVIKKAGSTIGAYLSDLGFNVDFAPDADVITNSANQVIGDRSFGTDPQLVADMAWAFCEGLHDNQILAAYKHFPGHGGTTEDSHTGYAFSYKTLEELKEMELVPFQAGCEKGVDFIMAAHISVPNVTGSDVPASLSKKLLTDLLREEMGYEGIIITDALGMGAIAKHYSSAESAVLALEAGCDMLLMPGDFKEAYSAVLEAVEDGRLTKERIEESVRRILLAKLK